MRKTKTPVNISDSECDSDSDIPSRKSGKKQRSRSRQNTDSDSDISSRKSGKKQRSRSRQRSQSKQRSQFKQNTDSDSDTPLHKSSKAKVKSKQNTDPDGDIPLRKTKIKSKQNTDSDSDIPSCKLCKSSKTKIKSNQNTDSDSDIPSCKLSKAKVKSKQNTDIDSNGDGDIPSFKSSKAKVKSEQNTDSDSNTPLRNSGGKMRSQSKQNTDFDSNMPDSESEFNSELKLDIKLVLIGSREYYLATDIREKYPKYFIGCKASIRPFIKRKNLDPCDYVFVKYVENKYITCDKKYKRGKLLLSKEWIDDNIIQNKHSKNIKTPTTRFDQNNPENLPEILEISDNLRFNFDKNKNPIVIRGTKDPHNCFVKAAEVRDYFNLPTLNTVMTNKTTYYKHGKDYVNFVDDRNRKILYLTYHGLVVVMFRLNTNEGNRFINWVTNLVMDNESLKLFTVNNINMFDYLDNIKLDNNNGELKNEELKKPKRKNKLIPCKINKKPLDVSLIKTVINTFGYAISGIYLVKIICGNVINSNITDEYILCKGGFSENLFIRIHTHVKTYSKIFGVNVAQSIQLICFKEITEEYLRISEKKLFSKLFEYKYDFTDSTNTVHKELFLIKKENIEDIQKIYDSVCE